MAQLTFLGTSAALPTATRANTALAFTHENGQTLLVDCGGEVYSALLRASIAPGSVSDLFLTHAHIDHIGGLPSLIESFRLGGRTADLRVWGLAPVIATARRIVSTFSYELTLDDWPFTVAFNQVADGQRVELASIAATVGEVEHALPTAGLRLTLPGGDVAYTSDTQPCEGVQQLARGAHLLITECTFLGNGTDHARRSKHTTAPEAGQEAAQAGVRTLALVHLGVAAGWTPEQARHEAAARFSGTILTPDDGDTVAV